MEENLEKQDQNTDEQMPPAAPEISIRTMKSDAKSLEQGGGELGIPQPFILSGKEQQGEKKENKEQPAQKIEAKIGVPGYTGPEKAIFTPKAEISSEIPAKKSKKWKIIGLIILILAIIAGLGLLGYFVISKWIFPA